MFQGAFSGRVPVCMRCGDRGIRVQSIGDGLWPGGGEGIAWVCDDCGHIGPPLLVAPPGEADEAVDRRWEEEYVRAAAAPAEGRRARDAEARAKKRRNTQLLALLFLVLAAVFLLPPALLLSDALRVSHWAGVPAVVAYVLGQTWLFLGVGMVLLVLGARKFDAAAKIEAEPELDESRGVRAEAE